MSTESIQEHIVATLRTALSAVQKELGRPLEGDVPIHLERSRQDAHGDFSTNVALKLAKPLKLSPGKLAQLICEHIPASARLHKVEVAGAGFINFFTATADLHQVVATVLAKKERYGCSEATKERVQIEFVSANPTGSLHVGHGRGAAYGSCLARILVACGYEVECEYYINDAGRQISILALSTWWRYLQACGEKVEMPERGYRGDYIDEYARTLHEQHGRKWHHPVAQWDIDAGLVEDAERYLDDLIKRMRSTLGEKTFSHIGELVTQHILERIRKELATFGVSYHSWFSESKLLPDKTERAIERLVANHCTEERDGNLWFLSTRFGDDRDRVVRRKDGSFTYFASDIAYHVDKFERGFQCVINVWGADHHGYVARVHAALQALGIDPKRLEIRLVQLVSLRRGAETVSMSTRAGEFIDLSTLCEEVGVDAARFFYVMRRIDQKTDFDLNLAKETSKDNPVYYIQYAHARLCSIEEKMAEEGIAWNQDDGLASIHALGKDEELQLLRRLAAYPETIERAGATRAPHLLATFLRELAADFHLCYNNHRVLVSERETRDARIALSMAVKQVLVNGLGLLGLSMPQKM